MLVVLCNMATMVESTKQRGSLIVNTDRTFEWVRERERMRVRQMRDESYFSSLPIKLKFINSKGLYIILQCVLAKKFTLHSSL